MKLHRGKRKVLEHLRILFIWSGAHPRQHLHQVCTHFLPCPFPIACPAHSPPPVLSMLHLLCLTEDMCSGSIFFLSLKLFKQLSFLLAFVFCSLSFPDIKEGEKNQICFIDLKPIKVIPPQHLNFLHWEIIPFPFFGVWLYLLLFFTRLFFCCFRASSLYWLL